MLVSKGNHNKKRHREASNFDRGSGSPSQAKKPSYHLATILRSLSEVFNKSIEPKRVAVAFTLH